MLWKQQVLQPPGAGMMHSESHPTTSASRPSRLWPKERPPSINSSMNRKRGNEMRHGSAGNSRKRASRSFWRNNARNWVDWVSSTRLHGLWALTAASRTLRSVTVRSCSRTSLMNCLIRREKTRESNGKRFCSFIPCSEQKIETLKSRFGELGIPPFARWKEVESKLKADKDPVFTSAEQLEQIT